MKYLAAAVACATIACGSNAHVPHELDLTVDPQIVHYLQYRDGDGPWQQPDSKGGGTYALVVTDTYEVIVVWGATPTFEIDEWRATAGDPPPKLATHPDGSLGAVGTQPTHQVTGMIDIDGAVEIETPPEAAEASVSINPNATFTVGSFDTSSYLFAYPPYQNGALVRVARRPIMPGVDQDVGHIDLATEAMPISTHPIAITGPVNTVYATVDGPGRLPMRLQAAVDGGALAMPLLPTGLRQPGDHYAVTVGSSTRTEKQSYRNTDAEPVTSIELMTPIDVTFVYYPASASWAVDDRDADLWANTGSITHYVHATSGWLAATGTTALTVHEDSPGFDSTWHLDAITHVNESLTLSTTTPTSVSSVTVGN